MITDLLHELSEKDVNIKNDPLFSMEGYDSNAQKDLSRSINLMACKMISIQKLILPGLVIISQVGMIANFGFLRLNPQSEIRN